MTYLLDTSAISALMREDTPMKSWLASLSSDDVVITCAIVRGEKVFGLEKLALGRRRADLEAKVAKLYAAMPCEPAMTAQ